MAEGRALVITTRAHPMAIAVYLGFVVLGWMHAFEITTYNSVTETYGDTLDDLWVIGHFIAGICAALGALMATFAANYGRPPVLGMMIELAGCVMLSVVCFSYVYALTSWSASPPYTTIALKSIMGLGAVVVVLGLIVEARRVAKAQDNAVAVTEERLAEADGTSGE